MGKPASREVEVFFDSVPSGRIQLTARQKIEFRARRDGDVGNNEAWVVKREGVVDGVREDIEAIVEKEDQE